MGLEVEGAEGPRSRRASADLEDGESAGVRLEPRRRPSNSRRPGARPAQPPEESAVEHDPPAPPPPQPLERGNLPPPRAAGGRRPEARAGAPRAARRRSASSGPVRPRGLQLEPEEAPGEGEPAGPPRAARATLELRSREALNVFRPLPDSKPRPPARPERRARPEPPAVVALDRSEALGPEDVDLVPPPSSGPSTPRTPGSKRPAQAGAAGAGRELPQLRFRRQPHEQPESPLAPKGGPKERPSDAAAGPAGVHVVPLDEPAGPYPRPGFRAAPAASLSRTLSRAIHETVLSIHEVGYSVRVAGRGQSLRTRFIRATAKASFRTGSERREILRGISAHARSGELVAIMGPSGSGKSSLLDVIAGRTAEGRVTGSVLLNGEPLVGPGYRNTRLLRGALSYVTQDDVLLEHLTVRETFEFSARLTLAASCSDAQRSARVDEVLAQLGLEKAAGTQIGGAFVRGVSGGEKRRVSIGIELIRSPSVLLLDEPTSGLSSADAYRVMELLKGMALQGQTVLCTIHQPSHAVFSMFDALLLLAEGRPAYFGPLHRVLPHFDALGLGSDHRRISPAEFLIEVVSPPNGAAGEEEEAGSSSAGSSSPPSSSRPASSRPSEAGAEADLESEAGLAPTTATSASSRSARSGPGPGLAPGPGPGGLRYGERLAAVFDGYEESQLAASTARTLRAIKARSGAHLPASLAGALGDDSLGFLGQTAVLCSRNFRLLRRNPSLFIVIALQGILISLIIGSLFRSNGEGATTAQLEALHSQGLFMVTLLITYAFLSSVEALIAERLTMTREIHSGRYSVASFFAAKTLVSLPQNCVVLLPFALVVHGLVGLRSDGPALAFYVLWAMLVSNVAASCTELFSALSSSASMAVIVSNATVGLSLVFGGFFVPRHLVPRYWMFLHYSSFFTYGFAAAAVNEFEGRGPPTPGLPSLLEAYGLEGDSKWADLGALLAFWAAFRAATMLALYRTQRRPR
eukprot:tig00020685_g12947.t1